jgi:AAA ATPase domain
VGTATRSRTAPLTGREHDIALLVDSAGAGGIMHVHGLAGMGKSALLDTFADRMRAAGGHVVSLDCRTVEPTERGFLRAAGEFDDVPDFCAHLGALEQPVVLVLDQYEHFLLLDTWLRRTVVPALPAGAALVLGCREWRPSVGAGTACARTGARASTS